MIGKFSRHVLYLNFGQNFILFPMESSDFENFQKNNFLPSHLMTSSDRWPDDIIRCYCLKLSFRPPKGHLCQISAFYHHLKYCCANRPNYKNTTANYLCNNNRTPAIYVCFRMFIWIWKVLAQKQVFRIQNGRLSSGDL